jgi:hypothetical protein
VEGEIKKMENKKQENKTLESIKKLANEIEKFNERISDIPEIDNYSSDLIEDIQKNEKMTKKQRKELALKILKEKMPKIYNLLFEVDLISEAIEEKLEDLRSELDEKISDLDDLENDKEDFEERLDNLR